MAETDENRKLQMITKLLERGGTMLASHHECGAPMFRYQGKVLCPVCDFQEKPEMKQEPEIKTAMEQDRAKTDRTKRSMIEMPVQKEAGPAATRETGGPDYGRIGIVIKNKIQNIAAGLENETDLQRAREKMECIELGIRILKQLEL